MLLGRIFGHDLQADDVWWRTTLVFNTFRLPDVPSALRMFPLWVATQNVLLGPDVRPLLLPFERAVLCDNAPVEVVETNFDLSKAYVIRPQFGCVNRPNASETATLCGPQSMDQATWTTDVIKRFQDDKTNKKLRVCSTLAGLRREVKCYTRSEHYHKTTGEYQGPLILIDPAVAKDSDVHIVDTNKRTILYLVKRDRLTTYNSNISVNMKSAVRLEVDCNGKQKFVAVHATGTRFSNRYQSAFEIGGNIHQRMPRDSLELRADAFTAHTIAHAIEPVVDCVSEKIRTQMPSLHSALVEYSETLPLGRVTLAAPFGGFVTNTGAQSLPHHDNDLGDSCVATGLDYRIGFVKVKHDADIVLWDSHPLQVGATLCQVFIDCIPQLKNPHAIATAKPQRAPLPASVGFVSVGSEQDAK
ncbi:hypothetical protein BKA62DRAFT_767511 [Auriculariales sp. MPI-PUGE-AT-0066]|nr:hypothetical protein BKA62DRAFT_767511 [Auriculariales sp. MPI-PUGE-AT-0066]